MKYFKKIKRLLKKRKRGVSLIEMLVVLGIMAILTITLIAFYNQHLPTLRLRGEVRQIVSDLRYIQQLTVTKQTIHLMRFFPAENRYELKEAPGGRPERLIQARTVETPIGFLEITFAGWEISFNFAGALRTDMGRVTLYSDKNTITIMVRPSGHSQTYENILPPPETPPEWPPEPPPEPPPELP